MKTAGPAHKEESHYSLPASRLGIRSYQKLPGDRSGALATADESRFSQVRQSSFPGEF